MARLRRSIAVLALAGLLALPASAAFGATTGGGVHEEFPPNKPGSAELVNKQNVDGDPTKGLYWNGKTITFHGEAIGERMVRGDYAWIHLNDDAYMVKNVEEGAELGGYNSGMAVWIPAGLTDKIDTYGDYQHEGSIVEIEGVFNGACAEHGVDTDIHATSLDVLRPGHVALDPVKPWKAVTAVVLSALALLLFALERRYQGLLPVEARR